MLNLIGCGLGWRKRAERPRSGPLRCLEQYVPADRAASGNTLGVESAVSAAIMKSPPPAVCTSACSRSASLASGNSAASGHDRDAGPAAADLARGYVHGNWPTCCSSGCRFALRVARAWGLRRGAGLPTGTAQHPPQHVGLGTGTQLGSPWRPGLCALGGLADGPIRWHWPSWSNGASDRPLARTALRTAGCWSRQANCRHERIVAARRLGHALPADWRFVLLESRGEQGLSGDAERQAFAELPPVPSR